MKITNTTEFASKRKNLLLLAFMVGIYMLIIVVVYFYKTADVSQTAKRLVQNLTYIIFLIISLIGVKYTGKPFAYFGIFFCKLHLQLLLGAAIGAGLIVCMLMFGNAPSIPEHFIYIVCSQLLVGISEETFWRGFVLHVLLDICGSKDRAVFISSLLFGLSHFPIGRSLAQVIVTFLIGAFFAVLRTEFKEKVGLPTLALAHAISNIF